MRQRKEEHSVGLVSALVKKRQGGGPKVGDCERLFRGFQPGRARDGSSWGTKGQMTTKTEMGRVECLTQMTEVPKSG